MKYRFKRSSCIKGLSIFRQKNLEKSNNSLIPMHKRPSLIKQKFGQRGSHTQGKYGKSYQWAPNWSRWWQRAGVEQPITSSDGKKSGFTRSASTKKTSGNVVRCRRHLGQRQVVLGQPLAACDQRIEFYYRWKPYFLPYYVFHGRST